MRIEDFVSGARQAVDHFEVDAARRLAIEIADLAERKGRIFLMGNGGSSSLASHFANDLMKATRVEGAPPIRTTVLTDNVPVLTAWSNDESYELALARQVEGYAEPGDLVIAVSTSGRSPNILRAAEVARDAGARVVAMTNAAPSPLAEIADEWLPVYSDSVPLSEAIFSLLMHAVAWETLAIRQERVAGSVPARHPA